MADTKSPIYSVSISGRLNLNLHSLNNEGTEGNQQLTRTVTVCRPDGRLESVNAISGDMWKHIQAEHLHRIAVEENLTLSAPAKRFSANRINTDPDFEAWIGGGRGKGKAKGKAAALDAASSAAAPVSSAVVHAAPGADAVATGEAAAGDVAPSEAAEEEKSKRRLDEVIDELIKRCAVSDLEGLLVTAKKLSVGRKSTVEFGWIVGVPDHVRTDTFFHVKYDAEARGKSAGEDQQIGQAIFHRPASSGWYASVATLDLYRIGRNDVTLAYPIPREERRKRANALLRSVLNTYVEPAGAHRNTQSPHIAGFEGVVTVSRSAVPAPTASALQEGFREEIEGIVAALNTTQPEAPKVEAHRFGSLKEFAEIVSRLVTALEVPE